MLIKYFYDDKLAQASYLVGCSAKGTAIVIDPSRDIRPYLQLAEEQGFSIDYVTETHIHADFVSGTRELVHATGATMILSDEGGEGWQYEYPDENIRLVKDGDTFKLGNLKFDILHTPGHTPEHISFMVTDNNMDKPMGLFTGDFLFVGDIGRPDLLEEAAGIMGTREIGAKQQFENIERFKQMPDYLQIWPGHGAGSACGKALGAVPSTTLGYEKLFNPAFQFDNEDAFVDWLLDGQPEAPHYFAQMKKVNKEGPQLLEDLVQAQKLTQDIPYDKLVMDVRQGEVFAEKHIPGTLNVPANSKSFSTYAGWYVNFDEATYLIAEEEQLDEILLELRAVGVDNIPGYFTPDIIENHEGAVRQMTPREIHEAGMKILDVRGASEYVSEHIPDVQHIHMGKVPYRIEEIPRDIPLAVQCGGGVRSQVVISILQKEGYENLVNMTGGIGAWKEAKLPLEQN